MEVKIIATLHLMVGLPCSGKTTYAKELEIKYSALRLTPDEWQIRLFKVGMEHKDHDARHDLVERLLWEKVAIRALTLGVDVILDFGFWGRSEREDFRLRASKLGAESKIHFLDVPEEILFERLKKRNIDARNSQDVFYVPEASLKDWISIFEPPSKEELG